MPFQKRRLSWKYLYMWPRERTYSLLWLVWLRATKIARNPFLQIAITHAWHVRATIRFRCGTVESQMNQSQSHVARAKSIKIARERGAWFDYISDWLASAPGLSVNNKAQQSRDTNLVGL